MNYSAQLELEKKKLTISDTSIDPDVTKRWFKRLYPIIKEQKNAFLITAFCGITGLAIQVSVPMVMREAIDKALTDGTGKITSYVWGLLVICLLYTSPSPRDS